jgi:hypothetical protein
MVAGNVVHVLGGGNLLYSLTSRKKADEALTGRRGHKYGRFIIICEGYIFKSPFSYDETSVLPPNSLRIDAQLQAGTQKST